MTMLNSLNRFWTASGVYPPAIADSKRTFRRTRSMPPSGECSSGPEAKQPHQVRREADLDDHHRLIRLLRQDFPQEARGLGGVVAALEFVRIAKPAVVFRGGDLAEVRCRRRA